MSNAIFPTFPGLAWSIFKAPEWDTSAQRSVSGKEVRMANRSRPIWNFSLSYEILRGASAYNEYQTLLAFYNARQGAFDSFLINDTSDNTATAQVIGTGDGVTKTFQLRHAISGWTEPIGYAPSPTIYVNGVALSTATRSNLLSYSDQLDLSPWIRSANYFITANAGTAPDGSSSADLFGPVTGVNSSDTGVERQIITKAAVATTYTYSAYVKAIGTATSVRIMPYGGGTAANSASVIINLTPQGSGGTGALLNAASVTGTFSSASSVSAQWDSLSAMWRVNLTFTTGPETSLGLRMFPYAGLNAITGDGSSGLLVWGEQLEPGSSVTAYIPTQGSSVTTSPDYTTDGASVTLANAPASGAVVTWSGQFYYRVRFTNDTMEFEQFMKDFWLLKKCDLRGVI